MLRRGVAAVQVVALSSVSADASARVLACRRKASASHASATAAPSGQTTGTGFTFHVGDYYSTATEEEQDKILEEEEFAALNEKDGDDYLPFIHRLAKKADAMDQELRRLRWELFERRQLLMDTSAATLTGRPARADRVLQKVTVAKQEEVKAAKLVAAEGSAAATGVSDKAADEAITSNEHNQFTSSKQRRGSTLLGSSKAKLTNIDFEPFMNWCGVPSVPVQGFRRLLLARPSSASAKTAAAATDASRGKELVTLTDDLDYLRRGKSLHELNYYSRMILTPKRHIGHGLYQVVWNGWLGIQNASGALLFNLLRSMREEGPMKGLLTGTARGLAKASQFLFYGWVVSPCVHIPRGLANSLYGPVNFLTGKYFFDALSGRWMRCTVLDGQLLRHSLQREKRLLRTIGRAEFRRKKMAVESKWSQRLRSMGFSLEGLQRKMEDVATGKRGASATSEDAAIPDPYQTLGVRRTATQQQIKQQYKKLAMVFHPDIVGSHSGGAQSEDEKRKAHDKFEAISSAYQILSNPEKRKAYDLGGSKGLSMHEGRFGHFMSRTPEQMVQSIFGGEGFRRLLIGDLLRSHWSLRFEAQVSVSMHDFEGLQCIRVRQMAMELAAIADIHAKRPSTGSYYKNTAANGVGSGGGAGRPRMVHSSSLPDPFGSGNTAASAFATRHQRGVPGSAPPVIGKDLKSSIMEELGDRTASSKQSGGARRQQKRTTAGAADTASGVASGESSKAAPQDSPFVLVPGSNEYNCFSKDFEDRCDKFVNRMSEACFGPELLSEVGEAYTIGAQRFLNIKPFYAPKQLMNRKIASGIDRIWYAFLEKTSKMEKEEMAKRVISEYFNMEYDSVVADVHVILRFAVQLVLQDCTESEEVRKKRCYAVWYLGDRMMRKGTKWNHGKRDDADMMAYIQQAATSSASTSRPQPF